MNNLKHLVTFVVALFTWAVADAQNGCTNPGACNFDPFATVDDGSCLWSIDCAGNCGGTFVVDACENCYDPNISGEEQFQYSGSIQYWVVPDDISQITIEAFGGQGGSGNGGTGGLGARIRSTVSVTPGETLSILVGGQGQSQSTRPAGGGGSFIVRSDNTPLVVAGGGGAVINSPNGNEHGQITENGANGFSPCCSSNYGLGGINGNGATNFSGGPCAGNGGGFLSDGQISNCIGANARGRGFLNGGSGGVGGCGGELGGFGGGGGGGCDGAGGGGGYSGGGASYSNGGYGGGGGSFAASAMDIAESGVRSGNGLVIITYSTTPVCIPGCTDPEGDQYDPLANYDNGSCTYDLGCIDPAACNYDAIATIDDGTCEFIIDCAGTCGGTFFLDACGNCYDPNVENDVNFAYSGTIETWTVPADGMYIIEAAGAEGGTVNANNIGGLGARMRGEFFLTAGTQLNILVGQKGFAPSNVSNEGGGGGGGTFVTFGANYQSSTPLIVAGGGGGGTASYQGVNQPGQGGQTTNNGPVGGDTGDYCDNGGAGFSGNSTCSGNARSFTNGGAGGNSNYSGHGGFGGGGASIHHPGGGGGGYSGGRGGYNFSTTARGGGSYNDGANQDNLAATNIGNGYVIIQYNNIPVCIEGCTDPLACNFNPDAQADDNSCILPDGCIDPGACNYDVNALCDNGTCTYPGCVDSGACNFDPNAACDDGSCIFFIDCAGTCGGTFILDDCNNCFDPEGAESIEFNYSGNMQQWTVPEGVYEITVEVFGAQGGGGGGYNSLAGGLGARMKGTLAVTPGQVLDILVGQKGGTGGSSYDPHGNENGGGGGSFVVLNGVNTPLIIAGGGGGGPATSYGNSCSRDVSFAHGRVTENGGDTQNCNGIGYGGTSGNGGTRTGSYSGGAGGGFFSNGQNGQAHCSTPFGGSSYLNGGAGGNASSCYSSNVPRGGFGGGGAGELGSPGGGGGYSGGGASGSWSSFSTYGGGGGSYNIGTNQDNESGAREGNGLVIISYPLIPNCSLGCTDPMADNFDPAATDDDGSCRYDLGCLDANACNFDETATEDDGSCLYLDCAGVCGGTFITDACGNCFEGGGELQTLNFDYTGDVQVFTAPTTGDYTFETWGAQGGNITSLYPINGGLGGYAKGTMSLTAGETVYIYVGGKGQDRSGDHPYGSCAFVAGGWNGGGATRTAGNGTPGGGASDIRIGGQDLSNRVIVGGGGGGGGWTYARGGAGGGLQGENGTRENQNGTGAQGGTQVSGGSQGTTGGGCGVSSGSFGQGGDGSGSSAGGGGGGGGWYGGGGGGYADGGGGGSSYVGNLADTELMTGVREGNGLVAITYSNVPECIAGCMDMAACNFNPDAGVDDGSCFYPDGCIDPSACNYDANALCDNGTCTYPGCVDAGACNYDPNAACDDGSCIFIVDCAGLCGGPYILDDCENCYDPAQMVQAFEFNYTGSLQTWTVPEGVTEIDIEVLGAQGGGGGYNSLPGGLGARMKGTFSVTPGQSFNILVGQKGQTGAETSDPHGNENGGGGGSFVVLNGPNTPYIIAGGGGGGPSTQYGFNCSRDVSLAHGQITENGATISCWSTGNGGSNGQGGTTGGSYQGGAGGGFNGNGSSGGSHCCTSGGGSSYLNGAAGGNGNCCYGSNNRGGYGGGGGGQLGGPGGGGGYSGGGTAANWDTYSTYGGGGGSYNIGTNQDNIAGVQEGNGLVIISYSTIPLCVPGCTDAGADNFDAEANYDDGSCRYDLGCTDVAACNFDPTANEDDGSCAYIIDCAGTCGGNFVLDACGNCYEGGVSGEATFSYTGSIENWIVPEGVTEITIEAFGAQGGTGNGGQGGRGARIQGSVSVTPGQTLKILVGGAGQNAGTRPGGGGGSFVATSDNTPLLVAGGGGGVINSANGNEHGRTVENGNNGFSPCCGSNYGQGGTNGNGATNFSGGPCAGNGGGFFSDGQEPSCASGSTRGRGFVNGGQGGIGSCGGQLGGFGGGGGGGCDGAGGGGGYSGGGASYADGGYGGGGGSYVAGTTLLAESGVQTGNGSIIITYGGAPSCIEGCTDPTACNYDANADLDNGSCILPDGNIYLECPDNITVMGEEGQTGVVVNYDMPLLFGICDEFSNGAGLADLPAVFSANYATLLSQLGSTYNFSYDGGANAISDGGGDMYDGGNYLNTNYSSNFNYTSGSVVQGGQFGPSGAYFTQQLPGMFILAADADNVSHFEITGNLGADGGGSVTAYTITSGDYTGFYKRVCSAGDPSVNQLMIVETNVGASQTWSGSTDNNQHRVQNINSATRIYYILWAGQSGFCYGEPAVQTLMNNFLAILPQGNPALIAGETSGSEFPAGTTTVTWQFEASDGNFYDCSFDVTVEIPGWGCTDPAACNYDPAAQFDNGSCIGGGCLDEQACNYDPNAPCDNGSCIFIVDCAGICGGSYVLDDCGNCYDSEGMAEEQFDYTGNIQQWIVPEGVTEITIEVFGAQGGGGGGFNSLPGGLGARMKGTFAVTPGQALDILVGQQGGTGGSSYDPHGNENGGGGGSFVVLNGDNTPLIIAGGGGGGPATSYGNSCSRDISFAHGKVTENGGDTQNCNGIGYGGTSGNGGTRTGSYSGGAGGGFFSNGQNGQAHCSTPFGGQSYLNGGAGGNASSCYSSNVPRGGFGGGGAGELGSPGGGGGYSGGGAAGSWSSFSTYGGGGGSYNVGVNQDNESGAREGNGLVVISYPIAPDCAPGCTDPLADNYDAAANFDDGSCRYDLGCMDANACNYDDTAAEDDGSCLYLDCEGVCGGDSVLDACGNCYSAGGVTGEVVFDYSGTIVTWTVPAGVTEISIEALGAQGGNGQGIGGLGARMRGTVAVTPGDDLKILVGQRPAGNGGGGGSFVATSADQPLVVAGGGGGGAGNCCGTVHDGGPGLTTEQGGNGINNSGTIGAGGNSGNGGNVYSSSSSAGGGGFYSNGQTANSSNSQGGFAFVNGGSGGTTQNFGGFGGGGSSLCQGTPPSGCAGGGGGGYSGGGGSEGGSQWGAGGGGGSFVAGVIEIAESGVNAGNGQIIIYYDATPVCVEDCTDPAACNFNPEADIDNGSCFYPDGCIDPTACNYDANALCDNGTCTYPGCVDAGACNFDPNAACDDGSCIFFVDCAGTCGGTFIEDACGNCFDPNSMGEETFTYTGSLQNWTVPEGVTSITIEVFGAQGGGGGYNSLPGGLGARMKGTFNVVPGEAFNILVGEKGLTGADVSDPQGHENGGGGGSFVVRTDNTPYIIAGGGGGGPSTGYGFNCSRDVNLAHGQITESGSSISCYYGVSGGSGGNGGGAVGYMTGGAGGGFFSNGSNGGNHCCTSIGGQAYLNGAAGGSGNCCYANNNRGGYGGGGGGQLGGPGGGGGYSGGATAADWSSWGTYGGGGGSYNIGTNQDNTSGVQEGNGLVIITYDLTPVCVEGCIDPAACNFDPEADVDNGSCFYPDGCIDPTACNYDANALCDNGTCTYPGCTDLGACNFDPNAACEDGSCIFFIDCAGTCGGTFIEDACGNCYEAGGGLETLTLDFTGDVQVFTAPTTGEYTFETWGAQGGNITSLYPINGGLGGYAKGTMSLTAGETVYVYVGGKGQDRSGDHPYGSCAFVAGGWNGGGATRTAGNGTPGGGASDIRIGGQDLSNRVIVAGGGGGGGWTYARGGAGGGLQGENGTREYQSGTGAQGGTQVSGGSQGTTGGSCGVSSGSFGQGGDGSGSSAGGGGGGGGWYGGGGGGYADGGGGGSSYVGNLANTEMLTGVREGNGQVVITFSSIPECIEDCTDPAACNFNPAAQVDNGSCFYPDGCIDPTACNYDENALCDNGTCTYPGCNDEAACNFDPNAACNDGSCIFFVDCAGNCGGPFILDDCENCYNPADQVESFEFNYTGNIQQWIVPEGVTEITIEVRGAQGGGGGYNSLPGGLGARMAGTFAVTPGETFDILVGQKGQTGADSYDPHGNENGGGGGSFVVLNGPNTPYIVAGGGGGGPSTTNSLGCPRDISIAHGQITEQGATVTCNWTAIGGSNGNGGATAGGSEHGGAGAGFFGNGSNGGTHCCTGIGGTSYVNGAAGGSGNCCYGSNNRGGYGGGGGGNLGGPGGGGGYSGGAAAGGWSSFATYGGGGGSYNIGTNQDNLAGVQEGNGLVIISFQTIPLCVPGCDDPMADNYDPEVNYNNGSCIYLGCIDPAACNFDSEANTDDGSCIYYIDCAGVCGGSSIVDDCGNCYDPTQAGQSYIFPYTGFLQTFVVPDGVAQIYVEAFGASGGSWNGEVGGLGAKVAGMLEVQPGQQMKLLVGGAGQNGDGQFRYAGGGGGSFVTDNANNPILIAGGGGGVSGGPTNANMHASTGEMGNDGYSPNGLLFYGVGGSAGNGATNAATGEACGGNGGGLLTNGEEALCANQGTETSGLAFVNGGDGGVSACGAGIAGGYGGGGGGGCHGAGGGGGYSGGGGSYGIGGNGGGGGSFNAALDALNIAQANTGNGYIVITIQPTPLCVPGCTDPLADNFDPQANFDDGSCTTSGCTDPAAANYNANATSDNGTCLYPGCTYAAASNYDMNANVDDGSCIFNDCPADLGCTDPTACNFNPLADLEDGSCEYASCAACTDANACNYNPLATVDNGSCLYADVCGNCGGTATAGCTNANACNFDPAAGCDDGSCEFDSCGGCTDPVASNYNPASTIEDGSCDYCNATVLYDVSGPDPIFIGSGISNNHMTVAESCDISASMKAMLRFVGDVVPQNNIYRVEAGESPTSGGDPTPAAGIARWNYLISVNLGDHNFNEVDVILDIDFDPAVASGNTFAANYSIVMADQGLANTALVQDSQNLGFDFWQALGDPAILPFDPFANGQYDFTLRVVSSAGYELISLPMVVEVFTPGCMDAAACNYNPQASEDDGSCEIAGCTDIAACNYNVNAVCDDATCEYMSCTGCTDAAACNYNANATIDDASCEFMSCAGCTDANACNYNPDATIEDDSCDYGCIGCTYATANNYNPNATIDDGSCTFGPSEISCGFGTFWDPVTETCVAFTDCPADLNGDGLVNSGDLLTFLGAFGTICE